MEGLLSPILAGAGTDFAERDIDGGAGASPDLGRPGPAAGRGEAEVLPVLAAALGGLLFTCSTLRARYRRRIQVLESEIIRLSDAADRDHLTGLGNRRCFERRLLAEWRRALRHNAHLTLALVDVDLFKSFNDTHGHPAGDRALQKVAWCLARTLGRAADCAFRVGGEEFALILPDTDRNGATIVAERVRQMLRGAALPHASAPTGTVTISFGSCSTIVRDGEDAFDILSSADRALYRAKGDGRDRAVCHRRPPAVIRQPSPGAERSTQSADAG